MKQETKDNPEELFKTVQKLTHDILEMINLHIFKNELPRRYAMTIITTSATV